jgi:hypothetical protein
MMREQKRTYVCRRLKLCNYLRERGFIPYAIEPDRNNGMYDVFLFDASPELNAAVIDYANYIHQNN